MKKGFDPVVSLSKSSAKKFLSPKDSAENWSVIVEGKNDSVASESDPGALFCGLVAFPVEGLLRAFPVFNELGMGRSPSRFGVSRDEGLKKDLPAAGAETFLVF